MATHVEIDRATKRLGSLIAAALRGDDIVLDRSGEPQVRLVALSEKEAWKRAPRSERLPGSSRNSIEIGHQRRSTALGK